MRACENAKRMSGGMLERIKKESLVRRLAACMGADETTATAWVDGLVETFSRS